MTASKSGGGPDEGYGAEEEASAGWGKAIKIGRKALKAARRGEDLLDAKTWKKMLDSEWAEAAQAGLDVQAALNGDVVALVSVLDYIFESFTGVGLLETFKVLKGADYLGLTWYDNVMGKLTSSKHFAKFARASAGEGLDGARKFAEQFPDLVEKVKDGFKATDRQLQKKFKHADAFGVTDNWNSRSREQFRQALNRHVENSEMIAGTYRGSSVIHYYDSSTGLNVIQRPDGQFLSGWKLEGSSKQHLIKTGNLGGG